MKMLNRFLAAGIALLFASIAGAVELGDDGLHKQPWFHDSFLEFQDDLAEARGEGKDLIVLIEQRGCPYCREMHEVNFQREDIVKTITEKFFVVQLNMWGSREVVDFDGQTISEKDLVRKWSANFTPTALFFAWDDPDNPPANMREALAFMMPGYFKPFRA
jgi:thioredoxin-related protein